MCDTIALGERRVKGKSDSVSVFVLGEVRRSSESDHHTRQPGTPLVGRDGELQTLSQAVARLQRGQGGAVWLLGEAGLGKSRIVAEASAGAAGRVRWLEGRALSFGSHFSFWPFLEILRAVAGIAPDDDDLAAANKLNHLIASIFPDDAAEILPYLSALLALPIPPRSAIPRGVSRRPCPRTAGVPVHQTVVRTTRWRHATHGGVRRSSLGRSVVAGSHRTYSAPRELGAPDARHRGAAGTRWPCSPALARSHMRCSEIDAFRSRCRRSRVPRASPC